MLKGRNDLLKATTDEALRSRIAVHVPDAETLLPAVFMSWAERLDIAAVAGRTAAHLLQTFHDAVEGSQRRAHDKDLEPTLQLSAWLTGVCVRRNLSFVVFESVSVLAQPESQSLLYDGDHWSILLDRSEGQRVPDGQGEVEARPSESGSWAMCTS